MTASSRGPEEGYGTGMSESGTPTQPSLLDLVVFIDELVLLAVLAVAGAALGSGIMASVVLAIGLPLVAVVAWGRWLAPRSSTRLPYPRRLQVKLLLLAVAALLLAIAFSTIVALVFLVVSVAVMTWGEVADERSSA